MGTAVSGPGLVSAGKGVTQVLDALGPIFDDEEFRGWIPVEARSGLRRNHRVHCLVDAAPKPDV